MNFHLSLPLLSTFLLLLSTANAWPPRGEPAECALSLISLSPCLSYISSIPDLNPKPSPSVPCCNTFFQSVAYGGATCMCYLVRDPLLLGFPVDPSRLVSLFSLCGTNRTAALSVSSWLYETCLETETLSPLPNIAPNTDINLTSADALWARGNPMANPPHSNGSARVRITGHILTNLFIIWTIFFISFTTFS